LTPEITIWNFWSPSRVHLSKWELPWECEGSLPHTFLHSREYVMWLPGFLLARNLVNPFALVASPRLGLRHNNFRNSYNRFLHLFVFTSLHVMVNVMIVGAIHIWFCCYLVSCNNVLCSCGLWYIKCTMCFSHWNTFFMY
jgi:hypothetical protein